MPTPLPLDEDEAPKKEMAKGNEQLMNFVTFRLMLTPLLIQICFWAGTFFCLIAAIILMVQAIRHDSFSLFMFGVFFLIFGPLWLRIIAESNILFFKLYDEVKEMNRKQQEPPSA
jgi:hypothetical protein